MLPEPQLVSFASLVHAVVLIPGWHVWHGSAGFTAPDEWTVPPMSHCVPQAPPEQIWPFPQVMPSAAFVHCEVLVPGTQLSQPLFPVAPDA
jgi:hypothetical protein